MNSDKESALYEKFYKKYNVFKYPELKHKKNGTLDMRYGENARLFGVEYKKMMLIENRKHNDVCNSPDKHYREYILKMTEVDILECRNKIEIKPS